MGPDLDDSKLPEGVLRELQEKRFPRIEYVSSDKECAAQYPFILGENLPIPGHKGELICQDGSPPWVCVLQGVRAIKTAPPEHFVALWERHDGASDQIAAPPRFLLW